MTTLAFVTAAYLLGSLSFAVLVSRLFRLADPRTFGSGNPGATNVLRSGKKLAALLTLLGDGGKGWLAVWLALQLGSAPEQDMVAAVAIAVTLGHLWPVFFRFKGGKGVATAAGVLLALHWQLGLICLAAWLLVFAATRISSLAALAAALTAPVAAWWLALPQPVFGAVLVIALLLIQRHKSNILALLSGQEHRFGAAADSARAQQDAGVK